MSETGVDAGDDMRSAANGLVSSSAAGMIRNSELVVRAVRRRDREHLAWARSTRSSSSASPASRT